MFGLDMPVLVAFFFVLALFLLPGIVGAWVAKIKSRSKLVWFLLCFIMPILVVVIAVLPAKNATAAN